MTERQMTPVAAERNPIAFQFDDLPVRVLNREGYSWFVLADVCRVLEHSNPSVAASRLDEDEKMTLNISEGHAGQRGGARHITIINEPGLYSLILTSRKPEAKRFKKWVTVEVLPAIRETGRYSARQEVDLSADDKSAIGGIVKSVLTKKIGEVLPGLVERELEARLKDDPRIAAVEYLPALAVVERLGVPQKGRRGFVLTASARLRRYSSSHGFPTRQSRETGRWLFHADAVSAWIEAEGRGLAREHKEALGKQRTFHLLPGGKRRDPR